MKKTAKKNYYLNKTHKRKQYYSIFGGMDPATSGSTMRYLIRREPGETPFESPVNKDGELTTTFINPEIGEGVYLKAILKLGLLSIKDDIDIEQLQRIDQLIDKSEIHFSFIADRPTAKRKDKGVPAGPLFPHVTIIVQMGPKRVKHHYGYHPTIRLLKKPEYWNDGEKNYPGYGWIQKPWNEVVDKTTVVDDSNDVVILLNLAHCLMEKYEKTYFEKLLPDAGINITELYIDASKLVGYNSKLPNAIPLDKIDNEKASIATAAVITQYENRNQVLFSPKVFEKIGVKIGMTLQDASEIATANIASIITSVDYETIIKKYETIIANIKREGVITEFDIEAAITKANGTGGFHSSFSHSVSARVSSAARGSSSSAARGSSSSSARGSSSSLAASTRQDEYETDREDRSRSHSPRTSAPDLETPMDQDSSTSAAGLETPMDQDSSTSAPVPGTPIGRAPGGRRGRPTTPAASMSGHSPRASSTAVPGTSRATSTAVPGTSRASSTAVPGTSRASSTAVPGTSRGANTAPLGLPRAPGGHGRGHGRGPPPPPPPPPLGAEFTPLDPERSLSGDISYAGSNKKSRKFKKSKKSKKSRKYKKSRKSRKYKKSRK